MSRTIRPGVCPRCKRPIRIRLDGLVGKHHRGSSSYAAPTCEGTGQPPLERQDAQ